MAEESDLLAGAPASSDEAVLGRDGDIIAPRITIEAFCATPAFATSMQTAAADRRMAKTKTTVTMGGVAAAARRYADASEPHLIIVETTETGFGVFSELETLAEVCSEEVVVIVAGPSNDVSLYRELIRQGVGEYLVSPSSPLQIIEAIVSTYATPESAPAAKTVAVYGVRGGVGASTIAHNLAREIADRSGRDTILTDTDLEFGTAGLDFNIDARNTIMDALLDIDTLDDVKLQRLLHRYSDTLQILPAPSDLRDRAELGEPEMLALIDVMRQCCDFLVVDTPSGWSPSVRCVLGQAGSVVLVATPDLACLRNLKSVVDWLAERRSQDAPPKIVLNQVGMQKRPEISPREFKEIICADVDATIPHDPAVFGAAQNDGKLLSQISGGQKIGAKIADLADALIGRAPSTAVARSGGGSVVSSLMGALGRKK